MMRALLHVVGMVCALTTAFAWAEDETKRENKDTRHFDCLDLQAKANHKLKDQFPGADFLGNDLGGLPQEEQTLEGVKFKIGPGYIVLGSARLAAKPDKVEGIKVGKRFAKLHILHAAAWFPDDNAAIGEYTITWEDDTSVTIPIIYGEDVSDWWFIDGSPEPTRAKAAWKGENDASKAMGKGIRLYLTTWENPKPDKKVKTIDFSSTKTTNCAPFCVAMTLE